MELSVVMGMVLFICAAQSSRSKPYVMTEHLKGGYAAEGFYFSCK